MSLLICSGLPPPYIGPVLFQVPGVEFLQLLQPPLYLLRELDLDLLFVLILEFVLDRDFLDLVLVFDLDLVIAFVLLGIII
jgi:hypothetical protein